MEGCIYTLEDCLSRIDEKRCCECLLYLSSVYSNCVKIESLDNKLMLCIKPKDIEKTLKKFYLKSFERRLKSNGMTVVQSTHGNNCEWKKWMFRKDAPKKAFVGHQYTERDEEGFVKKYKKRKTKNEMLSLPPKKKFLIK